MSDKKLIANLKRTKNVRTSSSNLRVLQLDMLCSLNN